MNFNVITLFPDMVLANFNEGVVGRAIKAKKITVNAVNPRKFAIDEHHRVDDRPYGGGPGMVMRADVLSQAVEEIKRADATTRVIALCPTGKPFSHRVETRLTEKDSLTLICGRYEGMDERFIESHVDEKLSIGDFVLSGGELGASVVIDAISRLLPDVLGHDDSADEDSFANGWLDCPHYTRPEKINGMGEVPALLTTGDHKAIRAFRQQQAIGRTWVNRPTLFSRKRLSIEELHALNAFLRAQRQ